MLQLEEGWSSPPDTGFIRVVIQPGGPIAEEGASEAGVASGALDSAALNRALDYPLRDVFQGVASSGLATAPEAALKELYLCGKKVKRHRLVGRWRQSAPEPAGAAQPQPATEVAATPKRVELGKLDEVWRQARSGDFWAIDALGELERCFVGSCSGSTPFVEFCRCSGSGS
jgi:hypothetical protein